MSIPINRPWMSFFYYLIKQSLPFLKLLYPSIYAPFSMHLLRKLDTLYEVN